MMLPLILALITAILFGISKVFIRLAVDVDPYASVLYTLLMGPPILLCFALVNGDIFKTCNFNLWVMVNLALAGALQLAVGRIFAYSSIRLIGASRASQLTSTQIVFAAILGIMFLGENMNITIGGGTLAIFLGQFLISVSNSQQDGKSVFQPHNFRKGVAFGLIGGLIWGASQLFAKEGTQSLGSPIMASFFAYLFAIVIQLVITCCLSRNKMKIELARSKYLLISGIASTIGLLSQYSALKIEQVIWVTPIVNTSPLITLLVSYAIMQRAELVNRKVVIGALMVVLGALFVTV